MGLQGGHQYFRSRARKVPNDTHLWEVGSPLSFGSVAPEIKSPGHLHYYSTGNDYYLWDETRGKWLSLSQTIAEYGKDGSVAIGSNLDLAGCGPTGTRFGYVIPVDSTIVGITYRVANPSGLTMDLDVDVNGSTLFTVSIVNKVQFIDMTLSNDVSGGDRVGMKIDGGSTDSIPSKHRVNLYIRGRLPTSALPPGPPFDEGFDIGFET
jgi:hypothetical protein